MQPSNNVFSLMCLNLRFGLADDGDNSWDRRKKAYPSLIESHGSDFFLFQEANDFQISFLDRLLPDHGLVGRRQRAPKRWQHNVIFHHRRWRCIDHAHFYLSTTPDIPSKFSRSQWPRQCSVGTFQNGAHRLTVINTHLDFDNEVQCRSAELIRRKAGALAADRPTVMGGDFNAGPDSDCHAVFTSGDDGFSDAFDKPSPGTFHGFSGVPRGGAIDWVLYRGDLKVRRAQVIQARFAGCYPSDHFPLAVHFEQP